MKSKFTPRTLAIVAGAIFTLGFSLAPTFAQGTAFTYQGRLNDGVSSANGNYDLRFAIYAVPTLGTQQGPTLTNSATLVSNGLFTVTLDFGNQFPGANRWLEIGVRTNGVGSFTMLVPRQPLTPTPYAVYSANAGSATTATTAGSAGSVLAANISGTLTPSQLPVGVITNGASGVNLSGTFTGNGAGVTNVNATSLGGISSSGFWNTNGNAGANPANGAFLGTTDNQPLELKVNNQRGLRLESTSYPETVNVIGGSGHNFVGPGVVGATIGGGGSGSFVSSNKVEASFGTISGGNQNSIEAVYATISGGGNSTIDLYSYYATISGGHLNYIDVAADMATIGGGYGNHIFPSASSSTIGGGSQNGTVPAFATIGGGYQNFVQGSGAYAAIGGGYANYAGGNGNYATVPGGTGNNAFGAVSFAAGQNAIAMDDGTFVWSCYASTPFTSTGSNQFLIRATGGVGINKNNPATALDVNGTVTATGFSGSGAGLTSLNVASLTGTVADAQLSSNVALRSGGNAFTGNQSIAGTLGIGTTSPQGILHVYSVNNPTVIRLQSSGTPGFGRLEFVSNPQGDVNEWRPGYIQSSDNGGFTGGLAFFVNGTGAGNKFGSNEVMRVVNGAVGIGTTTPVSALQVVGTVTATAFNPPSDRNLKENFTPVSPREVLEKVVMMPVSRWNFIGDAATPHVGPMAQDFHAAFGLGTDERHIATVDADGVALAAIQGLNQKLEEQHAENAELKQQVAELKQLVLTLAAKH
jgi:trimeric autotransporter adhesin